MVACLHAEQRTLRAEADRMGLGVGSNVLTLGLIQWETGFEVLHIPDMHFMTMPATLFRFGLHKRAELRVEFAGGMFIFDHPDKALPTKDKYLYDFQPLNIGTKLMAWGGSDEPHLRWIPRTSVLLNIGIPLTREMAKSLPFSGRVDLLFENDLTHWLTLEYEFGAHWHEWDPLPNFIASIGLDFAATEDLGFFIGSYNYFDCDNDVALVGYKTDYNINVDFGITYRPHPHVQLDLYAGFNCYTSDKSMRGPKQQCGLGFGVTWLLHTPNGFLDKYKKK